MQWCVMQDSSGMKMISLDFSSFSLTVIKEVEEIDTINKHFSVSCKIFCVTIYSNTIDDLILHLKKLCVLSKHLLLPLLVSQQQTQGIPFPKLLRFYFRTNAKTKLLLLILFWLK